ncbi:substrate-binding domain-containing protein [Alcaligenes nematophilus]|uniref:substrate-binding domain-containing protein n=1 Tax=Alcaligenes nematophilus TaxID=2994643 RepID=UPI0034E05E08
MKTFKLKALSAVVAAGLMMGAGAASAQVVSGGATLPEKLYNDSQVFPSVPGMNQYIGVGSGAGKRAFFNNDSEELGLALGITVDLVGSDSLVSTSEATTYAANDEAGFGPLIQIPSVLTSVTVPYNVTGVTDLDLTSEQLAQIFSRQITNWSAVGGPDQAITVVFRKEGSGTTEIFLRHLNAVDSGAVPDVSNDFASVFGLDADNPGAGYISVEGSGGVQTAVDGTPGAIGYVSPDFAQVGNNADVARINGNLPTSGNVQAALTGVNPPPVPQRGDPLRWGISVPKPTAGYPIVASTNLILSQCYQSSADTTSIRTVLSNLYGGEWDDEITAHGFIPMPSNWKSAILNTFHDQSNSLELAVGHSTECSGRGRPN